MKKKKNEKKPEHIRAIRTSDILPMREMIKVELGSMLTLAHPLDREKYLQGFEIQSTLIINGSAAGESFSYVYEVGGRPVGIVNCIETSPGYWYMPSMVVMGKHQSQGYGTKLFHAVAKRLIELGAKELLLHYLEKEVRVKKFYERFGAFPAIGAETTDLEKGLVWDSLALKRCIQKTEVA